jgi:hypothetical protein
LSKTRGVGIRGVSFVGVTGVGRRDAGVGGVIHNAASIAAHETLDAVQIALARPAGRCHQRTTALVAPFAPGKAERQRDRNRKEDGRSFAGLHLGFPLDAARGTRRREVIGLNRIGDSERIHESVS